VITQQARIAIHKLPHQYSEPLDRIERSLPIGEVQADFAWRAKDGQVNFRLFIQWCDIKRLELN